MGGEENKGTCMHICDIQCVGVFCIDIMMCVCVFVCVCVCVCVLCVCVCVCVCVCCV